MLKMDFLQEIIYCTNDLDINIHVFKTWNVLSVIKVITELIVNVGIQ